MAQISQKEFIFEYYKKNPNRVIPHAEVVDFVVPEYRITTGKTLRDPDRMIRSLYSDGKLVKVATGEYMYDPEHVAQPIPEGFTAAQRAEIMERGGYRCARCGANKEEGVALHADHIRPRSKGGKSVVENGQILCGQHNYKKQTYDQTETGKQMFIDLRRLAKTENDLAMVDFIDDVLAAYERHGVNSHIQWEK